MELKIDPKLESIIPPLREDELKALETSLKEQGQIMPILTMPDGTIIDGHHRYKLLKKLGQEPKVQVVENVKTIDEALKLAFEVNVQRRQLSLPMKLKWAYEVEKQILEAETRKRSLQNLRRGMSRRDQVGPLGEEEGDTRTLIARKLGIGEGTVQRAFKILRDAPEEFKNLWLSEQVTTNAAAVATEALESIPEEYKDKKEALIEMVVEDPDRITEIKKIVGNTNAVMAMIEGETDEVREKLEERYKPLYFTPELDPREVLWYAEEISQSSHKLSRGIKLAEEIGETWEEAHAWFAHYGGRCIREVKAWEGEWDHYQEQLEKKGKFSVGEKTE
jgi:ParB-like chromosome segregation protein Spo0J